MLDTTKKTPSRCLLYVNTGILRNSSRTQDRFFFGTVDFTEEAQFRDEKSGGEVIIGLLWLGCAGCHRPPGIHTSFLELRSVDGGTRCIASAVCNPQLLSL